MTPTTPLRPVPGTPRPYQFPRFVRRTLPDGLRLIVAPVRKLPIISVNVVVHAGAEQDPSGREGLAAIAAELLTEGTERLDGTALTEAFEQLGTGLDAGADWDATVLRLSVTPAAFRDAMTLLAEVLQQPRLPARELERLREERLGELLQERSDAGALADDAFARAVYAQDARYARPEAGDEDTVRAIEHSDVARWHATHFRASNATIVLAGDLDLALATEVAEGLLAADSSTVTTAHELRIDTPAPATPDVILVAKPGAAQSEVRMGHAAVPRRHPDYFALGMMNAILGGLFSSRINLNLREAHGYTYGAFTQFDWRLRSGPFLIASAIQTESTGAAIREVLAEVERIRQGPVEETELSLASSFLQGVFPIRYETTAAIAGALANLAIYDLSADYFDRYRGEIAAIRREDVQRVAVQHLDPRRLATVVVGEPDAASRSLEDAGLSYKVVEPPGGIARE